MNESLIHLYELQKIDKQLDGLIESRGELPERVGEMRGAVEEQRKYVNQVRADRVDIEKRSKDLTAETIDLRDKVEKFKAQQFDVKTTREYDAITFQLEDGQRKLIQNTEVVGRMGIEIEQLKNEDAQLTEQLTTLETELGEAEAALKEVLADTEQEEKELTAKRKGIVKDIQSYYMTIYDRVRPAKGGVAVVALRNGVCGGCYNAIPRQLALELRKGDKHTVCEYCGRIVVGEPIAIAVDGEPVPVTYETESEEEAQKPDNE